jgi:Uma2 family endonuclease
MARLDQPTERRPLTYEDYCALPDDERRYEIIAGNLHVTPSPSRAHQRFLGKLFAAVHGHVTQHQLGEVYFAPFDVILASTSVVVPDLLFVSRARLAIVTDRGVEGAPDLVVEALSPSTARRDRVEKMRLYATHGVPHYWRADLDARVLEVLEFAGDSYRVVVALGSEDVFSPALFPGLTIRLGEIWT